MKRTRSHEGHLAPPLRGIPFEGGYAATHQTLLTDRQREELTRIGIRQRLPLRTKIYREDSPADSVFVIMDGVVKSYRELASGKRAVNAFLYSRDLFGLAQHGRYLNTVEAITPVTLYRLPLEKLIPLIKRDADLQFQFLVKITHELRESQRRAILVGRRDAAGRLAMFLMSMREHGHRGVTSDREIPLPMARSDIGDFLGLSRETMSRAAAQLERSGIVTFKDRHIARILDTARLAKLAAL
jgi:CRP/FNR family transcriptional regulator, anaerobic regulatory protein